MTKGLRLIIQTQNKKILKNETKIKELEEQIDQLVDIINIISEKAGVK